MKESFSSLFEGRVSLSLVNTRGGGMKIAYCTLQMVTLIFLLFVSINGGLTYSGPTESDLIDQPVEQVLFMWGAPQSIVSSSDLGFTTSALAGVEVWVYERPDRSVVVRDGLVVSIRSQDKRAS